MPIITFLHFNQETVLACIHVPRDLPNISKNQIYQFEGRFEKYVIIIVKGLFHKLVKRYNL